MDFKSFSDEFTLTNNASTDIPVKELFLICLSIFIRSLRVEHLCQRICTFFILISIFNPATNVSYTN